MHGRGETEHHQGAGGDERRVQALRQPQMVQHEHDGAAAQKAEQRPDESLARRARRRRAARSRSPISRNLTSTMVRKTANGSLLPDSTSSVAADPRTQPQPARVEQKEYGGGVGRRHDCAHQHRLGPAQAERKLGDRGRERRGEHDADGRERNRGAEHVAEGREPRAQPAVEQDKRERHRPDDIGRIARRRSECRPAPIRRPACRRRRNTSSSGAPKRIAMRLDRMPVSTRSAPSRMAMLTASSSAMGRGDPSRFARTVTRQLPPTQTTQRRGSPTA